MRPLPVEPAWRLAERSPELRWLVTNLWSQDAVGIVGGEPKCCKSFLALDLAVAVAAGVPCLRCFAVPDPGRVLLYAAEDAHPIVRRRLEGIAAAAGVDLRDLDIQVITAPALRLDLAADRASLQETVARLRPRLLILDPFVRLHRIDENASGEVAPLLAYLRELQRQHSLAVLVVHHAKKGAGHVRAGQALRGSSEFHAWGDSNLYLRREGDTLTLTVEHRAAPSLKPIKIELVQAGEALALQLVERTDAAAPVPSSLDERITAALADATSPSPSPSCAPNAACVTPLSMSVSPCSPRLATSSKPLMPVIDSWGGLRDNHGQTPLTTHFRFPHPIQRVGREVGSLPTLDRRRDNVALSLFSHILWFGPAVERIPSSRPLDRDAGERSRGQ